MNDLLSENKIKNLLNLDLNVKVFDELISTNLYAKNAQCGAIFALRQTNGKGRKGKTFFSGEGGLYFSLSFPVKNGEAKIGEFRIPTECGVFTIAAGIAVCKALRNLNFDAKLKWVNDVFFNGKKACGILAEGFFDKVVIGIGVNLDSVIPYSLRKTAVSLKYKGDFNAVAADVINRFIEEVEAPDMSFYNSHCLTIGKKVKTELGEGQAVGVDKSGALIVDICGKIEKVFYGEAIVE